MRTCVHVCICACAHDCVSVWLRLCMCLCVCACVGGGGSMSLLATRKGQRVLTILTSFEETHFARAERAIQKK